MTRDRSLNEVSAIRRILKVKGKCNVGRVGNQKFIDVDVNRG